MTQGAPVLGRDFGKRLIRVVLAVVGLLILRAILDALPMVKNASAIGDSLLTPLLVADAAINTAIFILLLGFGVGLGRSIQANYARLPDLGKMVSLATVALVLLLAYSSYQTVIACLVESPTDIMKASAAASGAAPADLQDLARQFGNIFQSLDQGVIESAIKSRPGSALAGYQAAAVWALKQPPNIYGWTFLALIAIPVIGIVVLVSRNLDALTEMIFHAATAPPTPGASPGIRRCASCGKGIEIGAAFCPHCGATAAAAKPAAASGVNSSESPVEQLTKLKSLLDAGVLTREEYESQKQRLLSRL